jgi:ABC-type sulfate transport system permease component
MPIFAFFPLAIPHKKAGIILITVFSPYITFPFVIMAIVAVSD